MQILVGRWIRVMAKTLTSWLARVGLVRVHEISHAVIGNHK